MISHDRAQELISARMDAPLTPAEHRELQGHLAACDNCRVFVAHADDLARGLQALPQLGPSAAVSRAVMTALASEGSGWGWLRGALQALSSPGLAVASGLALVVALAGALLLAMNGPRDTRVATEAEGTIAAVALQPLPTEVPIAVPTAVPTEAPRELIAPEPTATREIRTVAPAPTAKPAKTPTPRPTATQAPQIAIVEPTIGPAVEQPVIEPAAEDPVLAMAPEDAGTGESADVAQIASEPSQSVESAAAPEDTSGGDGGRRGGNGRKDNNPAPQDETASEPVVTETLPVPDEAIAALENAGGETDISLPPAAPLPMPPEQAFLPITPTPVTEASPTPDPQTEQPQLADEWSGELPVAALAPETPEETAIASEESGGKGKRGKSGKDGTVQDQQQQQQAAFEAEPMAWSAAPVALLQTELQPQTTDPAAADTTATVTPEESAETATTTEAAPQIDPATGLEIDAVTGLLIDPVTGYLLDLANNRIIHPTTGYVVDPFTGLLVEPATGALLDPVTLAIVVPAGFGSDQPAYIPGDDAMRGQIEGIVDATYDDATYKVIPPTDGPVQPVDEIVVPTESGDAVEMS